MRTYFYRTILLIFFSFTTIFSLFAQDKKGEFKFENTETIQEFLEKNQIQFNSDDLFVFKDFDSFLKYNEESFLRGPVIHVFDKNGMYLEILNTEKKIADKLIDLKKIKKKPNKNALNIDVWIDRLVNFKTYNTIEKQKNVDFYFVLNWGIFFNSPNDSIRDISKWYEILKRQKTNGQNIQIILFNMDFQDMWNLSNEIKEDLLKQVNK